jgi:hypothetical protein
MRIQPGEQVQQVVAIVIQVEVEDLLQQSTVFHQLVMPVVRRIH